MARARIDRSHPINVLAEIERLSEVDRQVLRLVAEHEVMSTEQLAALCFPWPERVADAGRRLRYLATRALLVRFPYPGTHPAGLPAEANDAGPGGLPVPVAPRWNEGQRWAWSLGQGGAYWAGVERVLSQDRWIEAWSRFVPHERPHLRRRLALNDFFAALHHSARDRDTARLDQWWGPARCADTSGGKTLPDAHGRWRYAAETVPFWVYCDSVRHPFRGLITTVERHQAVHWRTERDITVLVMVNDNRERHLHRRWTDLAAATGVPMPPVATTSYRKLRTWPTGAIWWPLAHPDGSGVALHHLAVGARQSNPRFRGSGLLSDGAGS
uniref:replication-relaxation family protein n=1 Tax=Paractinoplanes polyasparticus TaxID=2856853 RepID=UPI001C85BF8E|nr:replication-relaxation family protein [Actinoplanes polyasparticus]